MQDIPRPHLQLKLQPKIWKSLVTCTYSKFVYCPKSHGGLLGVNVQVGSQILVDPTWAPSPTSLLPKH